MWPAVPTTMDFIDYLPASLALSGPRLSFAGLQVPLCPRLGFASARSAVALRCADLLQNVDETEIDLAAFHVDLDDLDANAVTEPVHLAGILPAHDVRT